MARTFSLVTTPTPNHLIDLLGETTHAIHADPVTRKLENGKTGISMGFPLLYLSGWAGNPEDLGKVIIELLNGASL